MLSQEGQEAIDDYRQQIRCLYDMYMDCLYAFHVLHDRLEADVETAPSTERMQIAYTTQGAEEQSRFLHTSSVADMLMRTSEFGPDIHSIVRLILANLYSAWEDCCRRRIERVQGYVRDSIKHDTFGDLGLIRNDIAHHRGIVSANTARKLQVLRLFDQGDIITLNMVGMQAVRDKLNGALQDIALHGKDAATMHPAPITVDTAVSYAQLRRGAVKHAYTQRIPK